MRLRLAMLGWLTFQFPGSIWRGEMLAGAAEGQEQYAIGVGALEAECSCGEQMLKSVPKKFEVREAEADLISKTKNAN
jgi:hypothetical protein